MTREREDVSTSTLPQKIPYFKDLPVELVRHIFELAAGDQATACVLCLVSTDVLDWILPILYHTVILIDHATLSSWASFCIDAITAQQWDELTPNAGFPKSRKGARYIKNLMTLYRYSEEGYFLFSGCLNIRKLATVARVLEEFVAYPHYLISLPETTLTHLVLPYNNHPHEWKCLFKSLMFQSVTHIHFSSAFDAKYLFNVFGPDVFPKLTHLIFTAFTYPRTHLRPYLADWVRLGERFTEFHLFAVNLAMLDLISISNEPPPTVEEVEDLICSLRTKRPVIRVVTLGEAGDWEASEGWLRGGESVWEMAERLLSARI